MNTQERNLSFLSVTLAAGAVEPRHITGARLWVLECDAEVMAAIGNRSEVPINLGYKVEEDFSIVTFRNANAFEVTIQIVYGTAEFYDNRLNVVTTRPNQFVSFAEAQSFVATTDAQTSGAAAYPVSLAAAQSVLLSANRWRVGSTTRQAGRRKAAWITNNDPLSALEIRQVTAVTDWKTALTHTDGNLIALVMPKSTLRLDVNDDISVVNATGSAIAAAISEVFYTY